MVQETATIRLDVLAGQMPGLLAAATGFNELVGLASSAGLAVGHGLTVMESGALAAAGAISVFGAKSAIAFGEYDRGLKIAQAISGQTQSAIQILGQEAERMSVQFRIGIDEVNEGLTTLGRAGLSDVNNQLQVLKVGMESTKISGLALSDTLNELVQMTSLFAGNMTDIGSSNFGSYTEQISDLMTATANSAPMTVKDVAQAAQYSGGTFAAAGVNFDNPDMLEDYMASIAAFARKGVSGSMAGTALRAFGTKPTSQEAGVSDALASIGIDVNDLWKNGGEEMRPISEQIGIIKKGIRERNLSKMDEVELWGKIVGNKMGQQMLKLDEKTIADVKQDINETKSTSDLAAHSMQNFASDVETASQQAQVLYRNFGEKAAMALDPLVQAATKLMELLDNPAVTLGAVIGAVFILRKGIQAIKPLIEAIKIAIQAALEQQKDMNLQQAIMNNEAKKDLELSQKRVNVLKELGLVKKEMVATDAKLVATQVSLGEAEGKNFAAIKNSLAISEQSARIAMTNPALRGNVNVNDETVAKSQRNIPLTTWVRDQELMEKSGGKWRFTVPGMNYDMVNNIEKLGYNEAVYRVLNYQFGDKWLMGTLRKEGGHKTIAAAANAIGLSNETVFYDKQTGMLRFMAIEQDMIVKGVKEEVAVRKESVAATEEEVVAEENKNKTKEQNKTSAKEEATVEKETTAAVEETIAAEKEKANAKKENIALTKEEEHSVKAFLGMTQSLNNEIKNQIVFTKEELELIKQLELYYTSATDGIKSMQITTENLNTIVSQNSSVLKSKLATLAEIDSTLIKLSEKQTTILTKIADENVKIKEQKALIGDLARTRAKINNLEKESVSIKKEVDVFIKNENANINKGVQLEAAKRREIEKQVELRRQSYGRGNFYSINGISAPYSSSISSRQSRQRAQLGLAASARNMFIGGQDTTRFKNIDAAAQRGLMSREKAFEKKVQLISSQLGDFGKKLGLTAEEVNIKVKEALMGTQLDVSLLGKEAQAAASNMATHALVTKEFIVVEDAAELALIELQNLEKQHGMIVKLDSEALKQHALAEKASSLAIGAAGIPAQIGGWLKSAGKSMLSMITDPLMGPMTAFMIGMEVWNHFQEEYNKELENAKTTLSEATEKLDTAVDDYIKEQNHEDASLDQQDADVTNALIDIGDKLQSNNIGALDENSKQLYSATVAVNNAIDTMSEVQDDWVFGPTDSLTSGWGDFTDNLYNENGAVNANTGWGDAVQKTQANPTGESQIDFKEQTEAMRAGFSLSKSTSEIEDTSDAGKLAYEMHDGNIQSWVSSASMLKRIDEKSYNNLYHLTEQMKDMSTFDTNKIANTLTKYEKQIKQFTRSQFNKGSLKIDSKGMVSQGQAFKDALKSWGVSIGLNQVQAEQVAILQSLNQLSVHAQERMYPAMQNTMMATAENLRTNHGISGGVGNSVQYSSAINSGVSAILANLGQLLINEGVGNVAEWAKDENMKTTILGGGDYYSEDQSREVINYGLKHNGDFSDVGLFGELSFTTPTAAARMYDEFQRQLAGVGVAGLSQTEAYARRWSINSMKDAQNLNDLKKQVSVDMQKNPTLRNELLSSLNNDEEGSGSGGNSKGGSGDGSGSSSDSSNKKKYVSLAICDKKEIPKLNVNLFKKPPSITVQNKNFKLRDIKINTADKAKNIQSAVKNAIIDVQQRADPKIIQDEEAEYDPEGATDGNSLPSGAKKTN